MLGGKLKTDRLCFNKILKMKFKDLQLQKVKQKREVTGKKAQRNS